MVGILVAGTIGYLIRAAARRTARCGWPAAPLTPGTAGS
jgi:hypothetical protein